MFKDVDFNQVTITDNDLKKRRDNTVAYLLKLDPQRFLYEFYKVAGLKPKTDQGYGGWERSDQVNFRGHFFGHYLSALSQALSSVDDDNTREKLLNLLIECLDGLQTVQSAYAKVHPTSAGYVSAFREVALDEVQGIDVPDNQKDNVIVPWYDLHKILAGLLMVVKRTETDEPSLARKAKQIAVRFGDYVYHRMMGLVDPQQMLKTEYGGMNDALYELFSISHDQKHLTAATYFDEVSLFKQLANGKDVLPGLHANTTIPKLIGALHRYELFQDQGLANQFLSQQEIDDLPMYFEAAANFFDLVVTHHSFVIGGNSQSEHFHEPDHQYHDAVLADGGKTCETCNSYNMLKLARELFKTTGRKAYLDYYERTYTNAILGSQNLKTGMTTYFQPMAAGFNKVFNRPFDDFWCCTGTGIENHTKLSDSFYFQSADTLYMSLYFANELRLPDQNLKIQVTTNQLRDQVKLAFIPQDTAKKSGKIKHLALRLPAWSSQTTVLLNSKPIEFTHYDFVTLKNLTVGDVVDLTFTMHLMIDPAQDNDHYLSLVYGPYVMAGLLGTYRMTTDRPDGILVRIAAKDDTAPTTLTTTDNWDTWQQSVRTVQPVMDQHLGPVLTLPKVHEQIKFVPYYQVFDQRYGIYFQWQQAGSKEAQRRVQQLAAIKNRRQRTVAELTNFDNNNGEFEHHLTQKKSIVGPSRNRRYRVADPHGEFSYDFDVSKGNQSMVLVLTFNQQVDEGRQFTILFDHQVVSKILVKNQPNGQAIDERGFYEMVLPIPTDLKKSRSIHLTFRAGDEPSPRLYGIRFENQTK